MQVFQKNGTITTCFFTTQCLMSWFRKLNILSFSYAAVLSSFCLLFSHPRNAEIPGYHSQKHPFHSRFFLFAFLLLLVATFLLDGILLVRGIPSLWTWNPAAFLLLKYHFFSFQHNPVQIPAKTAFSEKRQFLYRRFTFLHPLEPRHNHGDQYFVRVLLSMVPVLYCPVFLCQKTCSENYRILGRASFPGRNSCRYLFHAISFHLPYYPV